MGHPSTSTLRRGGPAWCGWARTRLRAGCFFYVVSGHEGFLTPFGMTLVFDWQLVEEFSVFCDLDRTHPFADFAKGWATRRTAPPENRTPRIALRESHPENCTLRTAP